MKLILCVNVVKLVFFVADAVAEKARVFVSNEFLFSLILEYKAGAYPSGAPYSPPLQ